MKGDSKAVASGDGAADDHVLRALERTNNAKTVSGRAVLYFVLH